MKRACIPMGRGSVCCGNVPRHALVFAERAVLPLFGELSRPRQEKQCAKPALIG
jgi:hypothetical protein